MQVSGKALATSVTLAGIAVAATQNTDIRLDGPVTVSADLMRVLLPVVMAVVPVLLTSFAPQLLPLWEWVKKFFPMPAELAEYQKALDIKAADPSCPLLHRKAKAMIEATFDRLHPDPKPTTTIIVPETAGVPSAN